MEPSTDSHDNTWPVTEELFAIPFAADILLFLRGKQGCAEEELTEKACDGKGLEDAMEFLTAKGLIVSDDGRITLTQKGEEAAEILDQLEKLFRLGSLDVS